MTNPKSNLTAWPPRHPSTKSWVGSSPGSWVPSLWGGRRGFLTSQVQHTHTHTHICANTMGTAVAGSSDQAPPPVSTSCQLPPLLLWIPLWEGKGPGLRTAEFYSWLNHSLSVTLGKFIPKIGGCFGDLQPASSLKDNTVLIIPGVFLPLIFNEY